MANLQLINEPPTTCWEDYALVPTSFEVTERLDFPGGEGVPVVPAYVKDYDALPGQHPREWPRRWDVSKWWIVGAFVGEQRVGGAVVVIDAREMDGATAAADAALLWDIRVHPDFRRRGVGRALLALAESHARACGRRGMRVETQDINVAACRLYADAGYVLTAINPCAYADVPDEVQLIWEKQLDV